MASARPCRPTGLRSGSIVVSTIAVTLALGVHPAAAAQRRRPSPATEPAEPIVRSPEPAPVVEAPQRDTIPDDLEIPKPRPEPPDGTLAVEGDDNEYEIVATEGELDAEVAAAQEDIEDPAKLLRQSRIFKGIGAPIVTLGAAALIGGSALGYYDSDANVDANIWVPTMVAGGALLAIGIPLVARGVVLRKKSKEAEEAIRIRDQTRVVPSVGRDRNGLWVAGVVGRF